MSFREILLHLSLIKGVGPSLCKRILEAIDSRQLSTIYCMSELELAKIASLTVHESKMVLDGLHDRSLLEKEVAFMEKNAVQWCTFLDDDYPPYLKHIHLPPIILFYKGALPKEDMLAIVGSRNADEYAEKIISTLLPELVAYKLVIVSGGAIGADTMAHVAALKARGTTVAVLGSGFQYPYPYRNQKLFNQIVDQGGALVTPFSFNTQPHPGNFPARNRIIAGMSKGCLVVQAAQESGAKITALFALEQGREVCAVPGNIFNPLSAGCHDLIKQGAVLVHTVDDIIQALNLPARSNAMDGHENSAHIKNSSCAKKFDVEGFPADLPLAQKIKIICQQPQSIDRLVDLLALDINSVQAYLFDLQLCGSIEQNAAGLWVTI